MLHAAPNPARVPTTTLRVGLALLLLFAVGCGGEGTAYDVDWLLGASSTFELRAEGAVDGSIAGTATFRTDGAGNLVGIELVHIDDSTRGLSIEMEPRPMAARAYAVMAPQLLGVERAGETAGFTAFFESTGHSFQAERGTLRVTEAEAGSIRGTFEMEMMGRTSGTGGVADGDVTVEGKFQATRRDE